MTQINWQYQVNNRAGGYIVTNTDWNDFAGNFRSMIDQTTGSGTTDNVALPIGIDLVNHKVFISDPTSTVACTPEAANNTASAQLQVSANSQDATFALTAAHDTEATSSVIQLRKADGSQASPALVDDDAVLGKIMFQGYDGNSWANGAQIRAQIDGTPADGDMPTEMKFLVTPDGGSETPITALTIKPTGESRFTADNDITDFTADNHGVISLYNTDGAVNDYTCLDWIGNATQAAARIGMRYTGSGSTMHFGVSNAYADGITKLPFMINFDGRTAFRDDTDASVITNRLCTMRTQTAGMTGLFVWAEQDVGSASPVACIFTIGDSGDSTNPDTGDYWILFRRGNGTSIGSVRGTGSASVNFSTTSDQTMKNDLGDAGDVSSIIDALKIHKYTWKDAKAEVGEQIGVFAQEVLDISGMPYGIASAAETRKEENEEGVEEDVYYPAGIDYGKLVPLLVQEIKSLRVRVAALES